MGTKQKRLSTARQVQDSFNVRGVCLGIFVIALCLLYIVILYQNLLLSGHHHHHHNQGRSRGRWFPRQHRDWSYVTGGENDPQQQQQRPPFDSNNIPAMLSNPNISATTTTTTTTTTTANRMNHPNSLPKIVFAGVVRNVNHGDTQDFLSWYIPKLIGLARAISFQFHIVILENDSTDGTRELLQQYLGNISSSFATLLFHNDLERIISQQLAKKGVREGGGQQQQQQRYELRGDSRRTFHMAFVRNLLLEHVEKYFSAPNNSYDYLFMMDMDGVCGGSNMSISYDYNIFKYVITELKEEWDVLSFRFVPYWDLWAFRHDTYMPYNSAGRYHSWNQIKTWQDADRLLFDTTPWPNGLIPVQSSYLMLAIYKMNLLNGTARYRHVDDNGEADCEHVAFHKDLREKMNARLRLSPLVYCQGDSGYKPLPQDILAKS